MTINGKCFTVFLKSMVIFHLAAIAPNLLLQDVQSQVYTAVKAGVKIAKEGIEHIQGIKKTKDGYVFVDNTGKIISRVDGERNFDIVNKIGSQIKSAPDRLVYFATNAKLINRVSPSIQGFVERQSLPLSKIKNIDEPLKALSSNNPIEAASARQLVSRIDDINKVPGLNIERIDFGVASADWAKCNSGIWVVVKGQNKYIQVAQKGSDATVKESEEIIKSLAQKSKSEGVETILLYGERKPSASILAMAEKENVKILYGNKKDVHTMMTTLGKNANQALMGKKEFYFLAQKDLESAGFKVLKEDQLVRIGSRWRSRPDFVAQKNNKTYVGEMKSPAEPPTSSSWRQAQKSDTPEFTKVRGKIAAMETSGKVPKDEGGWMIIIKGQVEDYARKMGKTWDMPASLKKDSKELYGSLQVPLDQKDKVLKAFEHLREPKMLNVKASDVEIIERGNSVTFTWPLPK